MKPAPSAPCALGIRVETLSALRDDVLTAAEMQRLRGHVATCAACQARLAGFDRVAQALRRQRDIEPGQQVWRTLQPITVNRGRSPMYLMSRNVLGGTIAVLSAVAIILLFAEVLLNHNLFIKPTTSATATTIATTTITPHPKPSPPPTATPISLNHLPLLPASDAVASFALGTFIPGGITPDGKRLLGYRHLANNANYDVGWLDIASQQFTAFDESPVNGPAKQNTTPTCCFTDGRYYAGFNGVTMGSSATNGWYYDTQTGQLHRIQSNEIFFHGIHTGMLYVTDANAGLTGLQVINLATGAESAVAGMSAAVNMYAFNWPYVLYSDGSQQLHVHDLQTNADVTNSAFGTDQAIGFVAFNGDTLYLTQSANGSGYLFEIDHVMTPTSTARLITTLPSDNEGVTAANDRLIVLTVTDFSCQATNSGASCQYSLAFDLTRQQLEQLSTSKHSVTYLDGTFLTVVDVVANTVTVFNTATLP